MFDPSQHPMGLYGALAAFFIIGVVVVSFWVYAVRVEDLRRLLREGRAILLHIEPRGTLDAAHIAGGFHIPLEDLATRAVELPRERPVVVCTHRALPSLRARWILRGLGFSVRSIDHAPEHAAAA